MSNRSPQKVIVGVDGSDNSRRAFHEAIQQAVWRECGVTAAHVVPLPMFVEYDIMMIDPAIVVANGESFLKRELDELEALYPEGFPVTVEPYVVQGHVGSNIEALSTQQGDDGRAADLVVLGSRGYGGIRGPLLGSSSTYAVHHLTCPLLIIPPVEDA